MAGRETDTSGTIIDIVRELHRRAFQAQVTRGMTLHVENDNQPPRRGPPPRR